MSSSIVMESSSNTDIDTSIVNGKVNGEEEEEQLLFVLPEDIVFEILLWLPVVSLVRFKSVCKSWFSLIQTSRFISQHKHKDTHNNNLLLMLPSALEVGGHNNVIFKVLSSSCGGGNSINNKFQTYENLDLPEYFKINDMALGRANMVICDGLVCLEYWQDISLWNPATKQFRILPRSQLPLPPRNQYSMFIGFGFDVETNDYKVIRAVFLCPHSANNNQIEVYSLTNNSWKSLNFVLPFECMFCDLKMPLPYHNGGIYCWMGRDYIDPRKDFIDRNRDYVNVPRILSFDFRKEIFGTIPLPSDPTFQSRIFPILAILREKLAAIKNIDFRHYQIWVMNEFGVRESWTKLYTVGPFSYSHPMGFPKNEDLLLLGKDQQQVCLCDPVTGQINNLPALNRNLFRVQAAVYKESLLPI